MIITRTRKSSSPTSQKNLKTSKRHFIFLPGNPPLLLHVRWRRVDADLFSENQLIFHCQIARWTEELKNKHMYRSTRFYQVLLQSTSIIFLQARNDKLFSSSSLLIALYCSRKWPKAITVQWVVAGTAKSFPFLKIYK